MVGILLVLGLSACGTPTGESTGAAAAGGISVGEPWVRAALLKEDAAASGMSIEASAAPGMSIEASAMGEGMEMDGAVSAGYMTLRNDGAGADRLLEVSSDVAREVQLHTSEMNNNVMRMRRVEAIDVPAGATVALEPGGYHLMLLDLKRDLAAGETVKLTLRFERAGTVEVDAPVHEAGGEH